jgi:AraC-like DNA-binding protein
MCIEGEDTKIVASPRTTHTLAFKFFKDGRKASDQTYFYRTKNIVEMHLPHAYLMGINDQILCEVVKGHYHIIFVGLSPLGLYHLIKRETYDLTNAATPLEYLLPSISQLMEQLIEIEGFEKRIELIEPFLIKAFTQNKYTAGDMDFALDIINEKKGNIAIKQIAESCRISERTLERKFTEQLGFSPKEYVRLIRFKNVMHYLMLQPKMSWAELAYYFGYADQSHLHKDFQYFAATSPERFMQNDFELEKVISRVV